MVQGRKTVFKKWNLQNENYQVKIPILLLIFQEPKDRMHKS